MIDESEFESIFKRAADVLKGNLIQFSLQCMNESKKIYFHVPSPFVYPSFFAWDSGWHIIALSAINPKDAFRELETLFFLKSAEGFIPHEILFPDKIDQPILKKILTRFIKSQYRKHKCGYMYSMMIDPPSYLVGAYVLYDKVGNNNIFSFIPDMEAVIAHIIDKRNISEIYPPVLYHPWESGTDASPAFEIPLGIRIPRDVKGIRNKIMYNLALLRYAIKYKGLLDKIEKYNWDPDALKSHYNPFIMDPGYLGILIAAIRSFSIILKKAGLLDKSDLYMSLCNSLIEKLNIHLWNEDNSFYSTKFLIRGKDGGFKDIQSSRITFSSMIPLLSGLIEKSRAKKMIEKYILNDEHFWTPYPVSFNSISNLEEIPFNTPLLWRGKCVWINMNWMATMILLQYGYLNEARELVNKTIKLILNSGFREYYHPLTGIGGGAESFSWPALIIDMIDRVKENKSLFPKNNL